MPPRLHSFVSSLRILTAIAGLLFTASIFGQGVTSGGLTGFVRDAAGKPVAGASVTAKHLPTSATYSAITNAAGRYTMHGLVVGGPYTVTTTSAGMKAAELQDVGVELGTDVEASLVLQAEGVVTMDKFTITATNDQLDSAAMGAGTVLTADRLASKPTTQRSFADVISASPFVTLRSLSSANDREEAHISALGQNNRYNSILIDGARINDQFGLNGTGLASFFNPLSLDAIEQISVQVSPYDGRESSFTGASINAVTRSGTNRFHGSGYYYFSGDHVAGIRGQGPDVLANGTLGIVPKLERETYGFTLGGPIWKDHLFFFVNYEKFTRISPATNAGLTPSATDVAAINARLAQINTATGKNYDWGTVGDSVVNQAEDKKKLAKVDWNIMAGQRLSFRYSKTEGTVPQFGNYSSSTFSGVILAGGGTTSYSSGFYSQYRKEETLAGTLISQWTPNFKTELRFTTVDQDQLTPTRSTLPEIHIFGISGLDRAGVPVTNGVLTLGTEQFRQGNQIFVDTKSYSASGDYTFKNFTFSGGFDREENNFFNLFRAGSYGLFDFSNIASFQADTVANNGFSRAYYLQGTPIGDVSDSTLTGIFGQAKWDPIPRLTLMGIVRYDFVESGSRPPFNQLFFDRFGIRNDGTIDGKSTLSPRVSFNYGIDQERNSQVRGGVGHFLGRAPWVFFSNSYSNPGIGRFNTVSSDSLVPYLQNVYDPKSPIGTATTVPAGGRYEMNLSDNGIRLPAVWRGNLAFEQRIPALGVIASAEIVRTVNEDALFITNDNLRPTTIGADGRQRFAGNPTNVANAKVAEFLNVYHVKNVDAGSSTYTTLMLDRPMKNNWTANLSYTMGRSTEAQAFGQTTASGSWQRNPVFNQNTVEKATSDFQVKNRVQATYSRSFEFARGWRTMGSIYYEGRSGNPYSFVYLSDLNGDSRADNDLVAVPTGPNDARFDFSNMSQTNRDAYFAALEATGLSRYAGGYAPKNAFSQPWFNRLDLKLSQTIPIHKPVKLEVFFDFINFGSFLSQKWFNYYEEVTLLSNDVFRRRSFGTASYNPSTGQIVPVYAPPSNFLFDPVQSRWRIQLGAKLSF